ncbi:hypothetical protein GE09DRAFT_1110592 [Coniochaeta sp. 2T2.1]|nr:hypothetical protein GE09DRAFT_1110592 [Coniochaeta sp. 2T2.1]
MSLEVDWVTVILYLTSFVNSFPTAHTMFLLPHLQSSSSVIGRELSQPRSTSPQISTCLKFRVPASSQYRYPLHVEYSQVVIDVTTRSIEKVEYEIGNWCAAKIRGRAPVTETVCISATSLPKVDQGSIGPSTIDNQVFVRPVLSIGPLGGSLL